MLYRLSYTHHKSRWNLLKRAEFVKREFKLKMARPERLELPTQCLEGTCSILLSYGRKSGRGERIRTSDPLLPRQVRYQAALRPDCQPLTS